MEIQLTFIDEVDGKESESFWKQGVNLDDWDCVEDLEKAELLNIISLVNGFVKLTDKGFEVVADLRKHKASGRRFSNFVYKG